MFYSLKFTLYTLYIIGGTLSDNLNFIIVDCDEYRLAIKPVGSHLLCLCADSNTGLGILKLKLNSISESFAKLLNYSFDQKT